MLILCSTLIFRRVGIHICYDEWFPEVARYYAHRGIQILLLPVAGGKPITWRTRAIDNGIYFVSSSINPPSMIIGSSGEILAMTHTDGIVFADLDLDYRETNWYRDPTLVSGMPCIVRQMRNTINNGLLKDIYNIDDLSSYHSIISEDKEGILIQKSSKTGVSHGTV